MTVRLAFHGVSYSYGPIPALHGFDLEVEQGDFLGIVGPNGSGKSTLVRLASGVLRPQRGRVTLDGLDIGHYRRPDLARRIAVVPQDSVTPPLYTVLETVLLGRTAARRGLSLETAEDLAAARRALECVGASELANRRITAVSGGERQRVLLARALAQGGDVLLLDEPSAFLDIRYQVEMYDLLAELNAGGHTILSVLHDLNLAALYCRRVALLHQGRLVAVGHPEEVLTYSRLKAVYGVEIYVTRNEISGTLGFLPLAREQRDRLAAEFGRSSRGRGTGPGGVRDGRRPGRCAP